MQNIIDFLTFKLFISPYILIICYYFGAVGIPIVSWFLALWIKNKYWLKLNIPEQLIPNFSGTQNRVLLYILSIVFFIFMEIMWRMMFEFFIAYLQIRDALIVLPSQ